MPTPFTLFIVLVHLARLAQSVPLVLFPDQIETENDAVQLVSLGERNFDAKGNGITFPTTVQPLSLGQSYVFRFMTGATVQWDTISVDLYLIAGQEYFVTNLVRIDPAEVLEPMNPLSGLIPVTIPTTVGTGPLYIVKIHGVDKKTNQVFYLPDSSYFPIINPNAGEF
ncbi:UNVERIFIED_CONTAM: hypothetical protein HDU68_000106 [Siphonaria sp. JEL0065]|nr:hypothetical protein HDU68_000106 [Siphonaria sp. JEL0065]